MPTAETLKSLIGLLETEPEESKFEFIVEPNGDLVRTISVEDETNFYMENETLPLDFNDIFEVNRVPSSFHGKIQATLGSIFQDCLLQNVGVEDKDNVFCDLPGQVACHDTEFVLNEPTFKLGGDQASETQSADFENETKDFKGEEPYKDIEDEYLKFESPSELNDVEYKSMGELKLEHDVISCLGLFHSDNEKDDRVEHLDLEYFETEPNLSELENKKRKDVSTRKKTNQNVHQTYHHALNGALKDQTVKDLLGEDQMVKDQIGKDQLGEDEGLELNAWKCRLYRARRKRKLEKVSSELEILQTDNKKLKLTHEKMLSNIHKMREFYIQSIQQGSFHITL